MTSNVATLNLTLGHFLTSIVFKNGLMKCSHLWKLLKPFTFTWFVMPPLSKISTSLGHLKFYAMIVSVYPKTQNPKRRKGSIKMKP